MYVPIVQYEETRNLNGVLYGHNMNTVPLYQAWLDTNLFAESPLPKALRKMGRENNVAASSRVVLKSCKSNNNIARSPIGRQQQQLLQHPPAKKMISSSVIEMCFTRRTKRNVVNESSEISRKIR